MSNIKIGGFEPNSLFAKSLIPILDALDWNGSNTDLIESLVDDANNMNKDGLVETLANLKFRSFIFKVKSKKLNINVYPSLYIKKDNIYVILGYRNNNFLIYDANKTAYVKVKSLGKGNKIIFFTPLDNSDFNMVKPQKNWFFNLISRFRKEAFYVVIISFLLTITSFVTPLFIMLIHSQIRVAQRWQNIAYLGMAAFVFIFGTAGFKYIRGYLLTYLSGRIGNLVSREIFRRLLYLPPKYIETSSVRSQLNRIRDFESITDFFSSSAITSLIDIPLSFLMIIGLIFISGYIVFVPLTAYVTMVSIGLISYYSYKKINKRDVGTINDKNKLQSEMLGKMPSIRLTGNVDRWFNDFEKSYGNSTYSSYKSSRFLLIINSLSHSIVNITLIVSIAVSVTRVLKGEMSSGALFSTFIIISRIMAPLRSGFSTLAQFSKIRKSIVQLNKFMGLQIEDRPLSITSIQDQLTGDISFNNIFLKYGQEITPALLNIKFMQKQRQTTVITGHGGCGKSSLLKILLGLYEPLSGNITIDNINIMQFDKIQLRKSIAYLPSNPYLFPGSIKFNLYLAKPDALDKQIDIALEKAGIKDDLDTLPNGLDTNVKELPPLMRKDRFIKRINLAMMLIKEFPLYIIDSLEVGLESSDYDFFYNRISELKGSATILLTTNKPEFIRLADNVMVLDSGKVMEFTPNKKVGNNESEI